MSAETHEFPIRWTRNFLRADAEQPTGTLRMLLTAIRKNQWVLLERTRARTETNFYPFTKGELTPRLEGKPFDIPVTRALGLEGRPSSQTVESYKIKLSTGIAENAQEPWLPRKVLLGSRGTPVAIGVPRVPRSEVVRKIVMELQASADTQIYIEQPAPKPDTPLEYSIVRIFYANGQGKSNRRRLHELSTLRRTAESRHLRRDDPSRPPNGGA